MHGPWAPVLTTWPTACRPRRTASRVQGEVLPSWRGSLTAKATGDGSDRTPPANNLRDARSSASDARAPPAPKEALRAANRPQQPAVRTAGRFSTRCSACGVWRTDFRRGVSVSPVVSADASPRPAPFPPRPEPGGASIVRCVVKSDAPGVTRGSHHRVLFCITLSMTHDGR